MVHVNQTDKNMDIQFQIMNGNQPFNVPEGWTGTIRGTKGDAFGYAAAVTVTAGSNLVTAHLKEQLTAVAGVGNVFELVFASTSAKVSTENFILAVEKAALNDDTVISESDLVYANQVLNQLQSVAAVNQQVQQNKANIATETATRVAADTTLQNNINTEAAARQAADQTLQSNINAEASKRSTADASLQSQIDQLVAPSGEAPSAAEVLNARIGADGVTYPTLGDAIRTNDTELKSLLGTSTDNLVTLNTSTTNNDVVFTDHGAEGMTITGTAISGGGRGRALTKPMTLAPGTYYACVFADLSESEIPAFIIQTVVGIQIVLSLAYPNSVYTFTLDSETAVFVGANVVGGTTYNAAGVIIYISPVYPHITTAYSAKDFIARNDAEKTKYLTESSFYDLREVFPFTIGAYNSSNDTVSYAARYRLISFNKYTTHEQLKVSMPTGYRFGIVFYDGDTRTDTGWVTGEYIIPAGSTFLLQLARTTDVVSEIITDVKTCDLYRNLTFVAWTEEPEVTPYGSILPISTEQLSVAYPWSQGACLVGRKVVGFNASADDHSTNGTARIYDADNNLAQIGSFGHNTGHASTADYCQRTDTMSIANGTYASGVTPTIYLVKNASAKIASASNILITNPDVVALDMSALTGQGVGACFGETDQFMYVLTVDNASQYDQYPTKYIYKLLMGKGSNDMTSLFASDNFGTFISGCGDNEYNGTAHLVASYSLEVYGELQGLKYRNGFLYMSCDSSKLTNVKTPYLAKMKLTADAAELVDFYHIPNYSNTGDLLSAESEGFVFDGAVGYVTVFPSGNPSRALRFNAII